MSDEKDISLLSEETNFDDVTVEQVANKTAKAPKSKKDSFFRGVKAEFKKIIWPNRLSLFKRTLAVLLSSIALGALITLLDIILRAGIGAVVN